ncbi:isoprenoid synthase domain-containing protein [Aspergillus cavernicola]|uniref:Isoprenoid synthase domain-containing protein n=1 Tax=Aspergillus cavernicola TaxID=176166 RepID=A0ABR4HDB2_9EURO
MACTRDDFSPKDFRLPDLSTNRPEAYFNTLPYRLWTHQTDCSETIDRAITDWEAVTSKNLSTALGTDTQFLPFYLAPECPPNILPRLVRFGYILTFWDDATDALEIKTQEQISLDLRVAILSELKLGRHSRCEFEVNELYVQSLMDLVKEIDGVSSVFRDKHGIFDSGLQAQTAPGLDTVTWGAYKKHRTISFGGQVLATLIPAINRVSVSQEELDSVSHMIELGNLITGLTNDFHSFHKEFNEHYMAGSLDAMHNGMAVLMSNYGYEEDEAGEILKQEVLSAEKRLMDEYEAWSSSPTPKSDDLRRYMFVSVLTFGGMNHWQSITPRYHRTDFTTTAADRAQLVGRGHEPKLTLTDYPRPALEMDGHIESSTLCENTQEITNGVTQHLHQELLAPFEKAPAEKIVLAPWEYIRSLPGKKTLVRLIECLQAWFSLPDNSVTVVTETTRMLFDATLMLDDIQDGSQLRRGKPAAHAVFGQAQTVNSATYLYVKGSRQLNRLKRSRECGDVFMDELETLAFGQGLELYWKLNTTLPSTKEYLIMVDNKTGGLFRLVLRLLEVESETEPTPELLHLFTLIGRYYQIRDDYLNLASEEYTANKGFCEDLSEGKFSFPLIHLLQNIESPDHVHGLLFRRDDDADLSVEAKQFILDEMKQAGSLEYTKEVLDTLSNAMLDGLDNVEAKLGPNKKLRLFLLWLKL